MWERCTPLLQISIYEWIDKIKNGRFFPGWASEGNGVYLIYCLSTETVFIHRQNVAKNIETNKSARIIDRSTIT